MLKSLFGASQLFYFLYLQPISLTRKNELRRSPELSPTLQENLLRMSKFLHGMLTRAT